MSELYQQKGNKNELDISESVTDNFIINITPTILQFSFLALSATVHVYIVVFDDNENKKKTF